ncbi:ABC transporter permease [Bacteroidota bacterium]
MFKNYLITFWKVLQRHKFFTFVSIFGISITLMVLIVLSAVYDSTFGSHGPEKNNDNLLYIFGGTFTHDKNNYTSRGATSYYFFDQTIKKMKTPKRVSIISLPSSVACYSGDRKITAMRKQTDAAFWEILDFDFLRGKPFTQQDVDLANRLTVLDRSMAMDYFGTLDCLGQTIKIDGMNFTVCGVVEETSINRTFAFANIYQPFTTAGNSYLDKKTNGSFVGLIEAVNQSDLDEIKAEYQKTLKTFPFPDPERWNQVSSYADSYLEQFTRLLLGGGESTNIGLFIVGLAVMILLFMSFPALNLVNINITRILERASEIGIRRSFGASVKTLLLQFLVENVLLTMIGGLIGFFLALAVVWIINTSGIFPYFFLTVNFAVIVYALILSILFGILSGVYPAFRMAKMNIVNALKS